MQLSSKKIAEGDLLEQTRLIYTISPRKFQTFARTQGYLITSLEDAESLANGVVSGDIKDFNLKKVIREIPLNAKEIKSAGRQLDLV